MGETLTANQVIEAAARCEGWGEAVFLAEVFRVLGADMASYREQLLAWHRAGALRLRRIDLAHVFDPSVDQSGIQSGPTTGLYNAIDLRRPVTPMHDAGTAHGGVMYHRTALERAALTASPSHARTLSADEQRAALRGAMVRADIAYAAAVREHGPDSAEALAAEDAYQGARAAWRRAGGR